MVRPALPCRKKDIVQHGTPRAEVEQNLEQFGKVAIEQVQEPAPKEKIREEATQPKEAEKPFVPVVLPNTAKPVQKTETQHRYLQTFIKKMAEARGYKVMIEETTPDGKGRVDVSLERNGKRIACEVSVTTDDIWEIHSVEKCLAAGYDTVIVCSNDSKNLTRIRAQVESRLSVDMQTRVLTLTPDEIVQYFDTLVLQESTTEKVVKGYRVKVEYDNLNVEDQTKKKGEILRDASASMKKKKMK